MSKEEIKQFDSQAVTDRIKKLLADSGMTRAEFSRKSGVTESTINSHLGGKKTKMIAVDTLYKYAQVFNVTMDYLISGEEKKEIEKSIEEKCLDIISDVLEIYGASYFKIEEILCDDEFSDYERLWIMMPDTNSRYAEYFNKISPIVQQRELLKELGVYEIALDKVKAEVYSQWKEFDDDFPF